MVVATQLNTDSGVVCYVVQNIIIVVPKKERTSVRMLTI